MRPPPGSSSHVDCWRWRGIPSRARELFALLAASGHRPPAADEGVLTLGLQLYEGGRFADAASLLEAFAVGHPRPAPRQQALYWAGLSLGRDGDTGTPE
jgi:TolA-binding protein